MPQLSTGLVIAGAYADKVRRVLFAQLSSRIRSGEVDAETVAYYAAQLNSALFDLFVNRLKIDKGDVVRIRIEYEVEGGKIVWKYDTLQVEVFRRQNVDDVVREFIKELEAKKPAREFVVEKAGETIDGDIVYEVRSNGDAVGVAIVTPVGEFSVLKKAVLLEPLIVVERVRLAGDVETALREVLASPPPQNTREITREEAAKLLRAIKEKLAEQ